MAFVTLRTGNRSTASDLSVLMPVQHHATRFERKLFLLFELLIISCLHNKLFAAHRKLVLQ